MKPNYKETLLCTAIIVIAGYYAARILPSPLPWWVKLLVVTGLVAVTIAMLDKIYSELCLSPTPVERLSKTCQRIATSLRMITIVSVYEVEGICTRRASYKRLSTRVYFWWIPRHVILSDKTKAVLDYHGSDYTIRVMEEHYIGQNVK